MQLTLNCTCGKSLRVGETLTGRKVRCPGCQSVCAIPAPALEKDIEDEAVDILLAGPPTPMPPPRPHSPPPARNFNHTPLPPTRTGSRQLKMAWKHKEKAEEPRPTAAALSEEDWFGHVNGSAVGGILLMALALAWLASGHASGYLVLFPPVLLVAGFVATVMGLFGGE